jgi:hypothetical protein
VAHQNAMPNPAAAIVDDLFLPLVAAYRGTVRSGA